VLIALSLVCCYTSPLASYLRSAGANKYDAGGLIVRHMDPPPLPRAQKTNAKNAPLTRLVGGTVV
jgi:hypothetical protein